MKAIGKYIIAAAILSVGWYFLLSAPIAARFQKTQQDLLKAQSELQDFNRTIKDFPSYLKTQHQLEQFRLKLNSHLYAKDDILDLLHQISIEAENRNLKVVEISPPIDELLMLNTVSTESQAEFINITLRLEGPFVSFGRFVEYVETAEFFRGIDRCEIFELQDQTRGVGCQLRFKAMLRGSTEHI